MKHTKLIAGLAAATALFVAPPASAQLAGEEIVSGISGETISLSVGTGGVFNPLDFVPAADDITATGLLVATSTKPQWTLEVRDAASSDAGYLKPTGLACVEDVDEQIGSPVRVAVSTLLPNVAVQQPVTLSGLDQELASATGLLGQLLAASAFTTTYTLDIPETQAMTVGCQYSLTAKYTLQ